MTYSSYFEAKLRGPGNNDVTSYAFENEGVTFRELSAAAGLSRNTSYICLEDGKIHQPGDEIPCCKVYDAIGYTLTIREARMKQEEIQREARREAHPAFQESAGETVAGYPLGTYDVNGAKLVLVGSDQQQSYPNDTFLVFVKEDGGYRVMKKGAFEALTGL